MMIMMGARFYTFIVFYLSLKSTKRSKNMHLVHLLLSVTVSGPHWPTILFLPIVLKSMATVNWLAANIPQNIFFRVNRGKKLNGRWVNVTIKNFWVNGSFKKGLSQQQFDHFDHINSWSSQAYLVSLTYFEPYQKTISQTDWNKPGLFGKLV